MTSNEFKEKYNGVPVDLNELAEAAETITDNNYVMKNAAEYLFWKAAFIDEVERLIVIG